MRFFSRKTAKKPIQQTQIGVAENEKYVCLVYLSEGVPQIFWQEKPFAVNLLAEQAVKNWRNLPLIRSVPHHYIWRKYLFLPANYSQEMIYRQIIQQLKQELPIPLEEIYFDFQQQKLTENNLIRVIVYALTKNFAQPLILNKNTILDCEVFCFIRGFHYLAETEFQAENRYQLGEKSFQLKQNELLISSNLENSLTSENLGLKQKILDDELYLCALGAALWNGKASI